MELTSSIPSVSPSSMASYPFLMPSTTSGKTYYIEVFSLIITLFSCSNLLPSFFLLIIFWFSVADLSGNAISLLDQNVRAFSQIRANLSSYKVSSRLSVLIEFNMRFFFS